MPTIRGTNLPGVTTLRNAADSAKIAALAKTEDKTAPPKKCVILLSFCCIAPVSAWLCSR